jgi:hypothetical protein
MTLNRHWVVAAALGLVTAGAGAGTLTTAAIETDADTGIGPSKTYTHLLDFGSSAPATINGVPFTKAGATGAGYTYVVSSGTADVHPGNANTGVTGPGIGTLLTDMIYNGNNAAAGTATLTLTGLTPGTAYETRVYYRQWAAGDRTATVTFDGDAAANQQATVNEDGVNDAFALVYKFTADSNQVAVTFAQNNFNQSWHVYGVTNEAVPEPATVGLLGIGAMAGLARRRR